MKLQKQVYTQLDNFGQHAGQNYTISADRKTFEALIKQLYNDPLGAVVRETIANGIDAQIKNGNENIPLIVHLPNALEPYYALTDFGCGLAPDNEAYWSMNKSDKDESDDYIGAFGLGSKTPFNIASQFITKTYWNGELYTYTSFIQENGVPKFMQVNREKADGVGTTIKFSVDLQKYPAADFVRAAKRYCQYLPVKPKFLGAKVEFDKIEFENDMYVRLESTEDYHDVLIGNIPYKVDFQFSEKQAAGRQRSVYYYNSYSKTIPFVMKLGLDSGLEIPRGRESIQETENNKRILSAHYDNIINFQSKDLHGKLEKCETLQEAESLYVASGMKSILPFKYKDLKSTDNNYSYVEGMPFIQHVNKVHGVFLEHYASFWLPFWDKTVKIFTFDEDLSKKEQSIISRYMRANGLSKAVSMKEESAQKYFPDNYTPISKLNAPKIIKKINQKRPYIIPGQVYPEFSIPDLSKPGGIYLYGIKNSPYDSKGECQLRSYDISTICQTFGIKKNVWILTKNDIKKLPKNWLNFWDIVDKIYIKYRDFIVDNACSYNTAESYIYTNIMQRTANKTANNYHAALRRFKDFWPLTQDKEYEEFNENHIILKHISGYSLKYNQELADEIRQYLAWKNQSGVS